jgi:hypothetical protein
MAKLSPNAKGIEVVDAQGITTLDDVDIAINRATKQVNKSYEFSPPAARLRASRPCGRGADQPALRVRDVLAQARQQAHRSIKQTMVRAYWQVGRPIVEHEQAGQARAGYGERLLPKLAERLAAEFGAGFAVQCLRNYRQLYLALPDEEIRSTPWSELSWSHLRVLMRLADPAARQWYAREAVGQAWSAAALGRQISTLFYERLLSSQDKAGVQAEARTLIDREAGPDPRDFIRDPYVLDFLGAKPGAALYEKDMEQGLLTSLLVPVPPKREVERIVTRVTELRRLCADLRQRLSASQTTQSHLAEALVEMAVA